MLHCMYSLSHRNFLLISFRSISAMFDNLWNCSLRTLFLGKRKKFGRRVLQREESTYCRKLCFYLTFLYFYKFNFHKSASSERAGSKRGCQNFTEILTKNLILGTITKKKIIIENMCSIFLLGPQMGKIVLTGTKKTSYFLVSFNF